jgi:hypothetical protein
MRTLRCSLRTITNHGLGPRTTLGVMVCDSHMHLYISRDHILKRINRLRGKKTYSRENFSVIT